MAEYNSNGKDLIVAKFGGSSMCLEGLKTVMWRIREAITNGKRLIVVVSAIKNTTDNLIKIVTKTENTIKQIRDDHIRLANSLSIDKKDLNYSLDILCDLIVQFNEDPNIDTTQQKIKIISLGEIMSSIILASLLKKNSICSKLISARQFIKSVNDHKKIDPFNLSMNGEFYCDVNAVNFVSDPGVNIYVTQGFIASTADERCCILTRSGSDTSASILAAGLNAERLEIWTDVDGMFTTDPNRIREAQLIEEIGYSVCEEIAASGSQVLHPYSILPCKLKKIPIHIRNTMRPNSAHTVVKSVPEDCNKIYAISIQKNITLFNAELKDMWNNPGHVHNVFEAFAKHKVNVDIIPTSKKSIMTTTDELSEEKIRAVEGELLKNYTVTVTRGCSMVSIIAGDTFNISCLGRSHGFINELGREHFYAKHYSSNNRNISFVVDSSITVRFARMLHDEFIMKRVNRPINEEIWWRHGGKDRKLKRLYAELTKDSPHRTFYVYDKIDIQSACTELMNNLHPTIKRFHYAMKANTNEDVIKAIVDEGFGLECVSTAELDLAAKYLVINTDNTLFTPNFCHVDEYRHALSVGAMVIIDNCNLLVQHGDIFMGHEIGVRIDLDQGDGHNKRVVTEGNKNKFGLPMDQVGELIEIADLHNIKITLLHSHKGSGIHNPKAWAETLHKMTPLLRRFTDVKTINLGGGLGVFDGGKDLDLKAVNAELQREYRVMRHEIGRDVELIMEPGRRIVSEAGVILTSVTQVRSKGSYNYMGVDAGMHTLIRPTLYGSHHSIHNLTRSDEEYNTIYQVVGPICESGDFLGKNVKLPIANVGDIILIENAGAYGRVMSSTYNMRPLAPEVIFE